MKLHKVCKRTYLDFTHNFIRAETLKKLKIKKILIVSEVNKSGRIWKKNAHVTCLAVTIRMKTAELFWPN